MFLHLATLTKTASTKQPNWQITGPATSERSVCVRFRVFLQSAAKCIAFPTTTSNLRVKSGAVPNLCSVVFLVPVLLWGGNSSCFCVFLMSDRGRFPQVGGCCGFGVLPDVTDVVADWKVVQSCKKYGGILGNLLLQRIHHKEPEFEKCFPNPEQAKKCIVNVLLSVCIN